MSVCVFLRHCVLISIESHRTRQTVSFASDKCMKIQGQKTKNEKLWRDVTICPFGTGENELEQCEDKERQKGSSMCVYMCNMKPMSFILLVSGGAYNVVRCTCSCVKHVRTCFGIIAVRYALNKFHKLHVVVNVN